MEQNPWWSCLFGMKVHKSHFYAFTGSLPHIFHTWEQPCCDCEFYYLILSLEISLVLKTEISPSGFVVLVVVIVIITNLFIFCFVFARVLVVFFWLLFVCLFVCLVAWLFGWLAGWLVCWLLGFVFVDYAVLLAFCQRWNLVVLHLRDQVSSVKMCQSESSLGESCVRKLAKICCLVKQPN